MPCAVVSFTTWKKVVPKYCCSLVKYKTIHRSLNFIFQKMMTAKKKWLRHIPHSFFLHAVFTLSFLELLPLLKWNRNRLLGAPSARSLSLGIRWYVIPSLCSLQPTYYLVFSPQCAFWTETPSPPTSNLVLKYPYTKQLLIPSNLSVCLSSSC